MGAPDGRGGAGVRRGRLSGPNGRYAAVAALAMLARASDSMSGPKDPGAVIEDLLPAVHAGRGDLDVRPERWDAPGRLAAVEAALKDPLGLPAALRAWEPALKDGRSDRLLDLAGELLGGYVAGLAAASPVSEKRTSGPVGRTAQAGPGSSGQDDAPRRAGARLLPRSAARELPAELAGPVEEVLSAIAGAKAAAAEALRGWPASRRGRALAAAKSRLLNERLSRPEPGGFEALAAYDPRPLVAAASGLARAVEAALPRLEAGAGLWKGGRRRWRTPAGLVVVAGPGDDEYTAGDLAGVALLVDLGGRNSYGAAPAQAGPGEVKVVIDLGAEVSVSAAGGSPASGLFGIGLMYLPNPAGPKRLAGGDSSLGAGLFGVGGLVLAGPGSSLEAGRFSQGAGASGAGFLRAEGDGLKLSARSSAQGFGFTAGVGLLSQAGGSATVRGGFVDPDPREPQASVSLCQGVGMGPRAFAGGGAGLALVQGSGNSLEASYFGQGSGYGPGLGALYVEGDLNRLQARRYVQGAGVHTAAGALVIRGDGNKVASWGVGPAFGWDWGIGWLDVGGSRNDLRADWGTGRGDVNGHAFASIRGDGNRLSLPGFGSGSFKRTSAGYGVAAVEGKGNLFRAPWASTAPVRAASAAASASAPAAVTAPAAAATVTAGLLVRADPWGVLAGPGLELAPGLELQAPEWPGLDPREALDVERALLRRLYREAERKPAAERVADWLSIASTFGIEAGVPRIAAGRLLGLAPDEVAALAARASAERFDELVWLRPALAAYGAAAGEAVRKEIAVSSGTRKAVAVGLLRWLPAAEALAAATGAAADQDWRVRREAAGVIASLWDGSEGEEPGRLHLLREAADLAGGGGADIQALLEERLPKRLGAKRLPDLLAALALDPGLLAEDRFKVFGQAPNPVDPVPPPALAAFAAVLAGKPAYKGLIGRELESAAALADQARRVLLGLRDDPEPEVIQAAAMAMAAMGRPEDAAWIAGLLEHPSAGLRRAAAAGLARLGPAGRDEVSRSLSAGAPGTRALAATAAGQSWDAGTLALLGRALDDQDPEVRAVAASAVSAVQAPLQARRRDFVPALERLRDADPSASVRASAGLARSLIAP